MRPTSASSTAPTAGLALVVALGLGGATMLAGVAIGAEAADPVPPPATASAAGREGPRPEAGAAVVDAALALRQQSLAASCAACHGTEGRPPAGSPVPPLAGRPKAELVERLHAFREGRRPSTVMQQLAKGYDDAQIEALGTFFALQPSPNRP